jgi:hypothetical protein
MCCGEAFWKRVVAFCLTFGLSVFVAGLFVSGKVSQTVKPVVVPSIEENKNCVPADKNLKFERLTTEDRNIPMDGKTEIPLDGKESLKTEKTKDKKRNLKAETEKPKNSAEPQLYDASKNPAEVKDLLHKEICFETQAR